MYIRDKLRIQEDTQLENHWQGAPGEGKKCELDLVGITEKGRCFFALCNQDIVRSI